MRTNSQGKSQDGSHLGYLQIDHQKVSLRAHPNLSGLLTQTYDVGPASGRHVQPCPASAAGGVAHHHAKGKTLCCFAVIHHAKGVAACAIGAHAQTNALNPHGLRRGDRIAFPGTGNRVVGNRCIQVGQQADFARCHQGGMGQQRGGAQGTNMSQMLDGAAAMGIQGAFYGNQVFVGMGLKDAASLFAHGIDTMQHGVTGSFRDGDSQRGADQIVVLPLL